MRYLLHLQQYQDIFPRLVLQPALQAIGQNFPALQHNCHDYTLVVLKAEKEKLMKLTNQQLTCLYISASIHLLVNNRSELTGTFESIL